MFDWLILLAYVVPTVEKYLANYVAISFALYVSMVPIFRYSTNDDLPLVLLVILFIIFHNLEVFLLKLMYLSL